MCFSFFLFSRRSFSFHPLLFFPFFFSPLRSDHVAFSWLGGPLPWFLNSLARPDKGLTSLDKPGHALGVVVDYKWASRQPGQALWTNQVPPLVATEADPVSCRSLFAPSSPHPVTGVAFSGLGPYGAVSLARALVCSSFSVLPSALVFCSLFAAIVITISPLQFVLPHGLSKAAT
jgi:hypothetical protein